MIRSCTRLGDRCHIGDYRQDGFGKNERWLDMKRVEKGEYILEVAYATQFRLSPGILLITSDQGTHKPLHRIDHACGRYVTRRETFIRRPPKLFTVN